MATAESQRFSEVYPAPCTPKEDREEAPGGIRAQEQKRLVLHFQGCGMRRT